MAQEEYNKLFVGGDLSGIQKFLYNITSRHASVSLKGRSAFLNNYLRKVYGSIIDICGETCDELYCSGGKFYLTTDNKPTIIQSIEDCAKHTKEELWEEHWGHLSINISHVPFAENEDGTVNVDGNSHVSSGELWRIVNADFARQKNQKFKDVLLTHFNKFFNEKDDSLKVGGKPKVCALTGIESEKCRPLSQKDFEMKGLFNVHLDGEKTDSGLRIYLPSVIEQIVNGVKLTREHKIKTFEDYADGSYLGVLRMDVDGLGKRFIIGFSSISRYKEFSKQVTNFFEGNEKKGVQSVIEKLLKNEPKEKQWKYKDHLCIIYAGGDDLFIVGRWDKVIEFAKKIHDAIACPDQEIQSEDYNFSRDYYDPYEPDIQKRGKHISISGGIVIVKPKFPIAKAANMAGEAEDAAKQGEKDAFNMFGKTISWNANKPFEVDKEVYKHEYAYVEAFKDKFVEYISKYNKDYGFSKSILHKIMLYAEIADLNIEREAKGKPKNYSYMWHISYYMTRFMGKYKNHGDDNVKKTLYDFCHRLRDDHLPKNKGRNLQLLAIAARWAELLLKDREKTNNN